MFPACLLFYQDKLRRTQLRGKKHFHIPIKIQLTKIECQRKCQCSWVCLWVCITRNLDFRGGGALKSYC